MFKIVMLVKRSSILSHREFIEHWKAHSEKVLKFREVLNIVSYSKTFPLEEGGAPVTGRDAMSFGYDAMGELWYKDQEAFITARNSEKGREALKILQDDERKFVDMQNSVMWFGLEEKIL